MPETYWRKLDVWVSQSGMSQSFVIRSMIEHLAHCDFKRDEDSIFIQFIPRKIP